MRLNAITAAAILAFTSVAIAMDGDAAGSASTAVSHPVAQVSAEINILSDNTDRVGSEDDFDEDEVDSIGKRWNRGTSKSQREYINAVKQKSPFLEWKRGEESPEQDEHSYNDVDGDEESNGVEKRFNRGAHRQFFGTGSWQSPMYPLKRSEGSDEQDEHSPDDVDEEEGSGVEKRFNRGAHRQFFGTGSWQSPMYPLKRSEGSDDQDEYPHNDEEDHHDGEEKREMKPYVPGTNPKMENWRENHTHHNNKSGAENSNMGPGGRQSLENKDQHGKTKRDIVQDEIENRIEIDNQTENENDQEHEDSPSAFRRRGNKGPTYVWEGHPGVIKDGKTNKVIWDSSKDAPKGKVKTKA